MASSSWVFWRAYPQMLKIVYIFSSGLVRILNMFVFKFSGLKVWFTSSCVSRPLLYDADPEGWRKRKRAPGGVMEKALILQQATR